MDRGPPAFEIAAEISHDDVRRILDGTSTISPTSGSPPITARSLGSAVPLGHAPVVGSTDESIDYVCRGPWPKEPSSRRAGGRVSTSRWSIGKKLAQSDRGGSGAMT